jgi:hypothetical protein
LHNSLWDVLTRGSVDREANIIGMRLGPGKYLKGRTLLGGVITPEEFDHFHEVGCSRSVCLTVLMLTV